MFSSAVYGSIAMPEDYSRGFTYARDDVCRAAIPDGRSVRQTSHHITSHGLGMIVILSIHPYICMYVCMYGM